MPGAGRSEAGRSGVDVLVSGPPLTGFEGPGPPNRETKTRGSAARFLRAQAPLWKKTKRVITDFEAKKWVDNREGPRLPTTTTTTGLNKD